MNGDEHKSTKVNTCRGSVTVCGENPQTKLSTIVGRVFVEEFGGTKKYYIKPIGNFCQFYYYIRLCRNYYKEEVLPYDGEWVICDVEIGEDRMLPHSIRRLHIDVHDLELTIQCISDVSYQWVGDDEVKHICDSVLDYFQKNNEGKQIIFDYASHVLNTNGDITNRYVIVFLNSYRVFEFLTQPNVYGIHTLNNVDNEEILLNLAKVKIKTYNDLDFKKILPNLRRTSCGMLWNTLYVRLKDDFNKARWFIYRLPEQFINDVVDVNTPFADPQIRTYLFERGADLDIILDESVVDMWNTKALQGEEIIARELCRKPYHGKRAEIKSYILETGRANDSLKLALYLCSCDNRILDMLSKEFILSAVEKMNDDSVSRFISNLNIRHESLINDLCKILGTERMLALFLCSGDNRILDLLGECSVLSTVEKMSDSTVSGFISNIDIRHESLINDLCKILGIERIVDITLLGDNREKIIKYLPSKHVIYLDAYVGVTHEYITTESTDWYGGYWTWGEGMVNRKYDIFTLKKIEYIVILFSNREYMLDIDHITEESTKKIRRAINEYMRAALEKVLKSVNDASLKVSPQIRGGQGEKLIKVVNNNGRTFLACLKIKLIDKLYSGSSNQVKVMSFENEVASIILNKETICER